MKSIAIILLLAFFVGLFFLFLIKNKSHLNKSKNTNNKEKIIDAEYEEVEKRKKK
jgi:hypothetical protein